MGTGSGMNKLIRPLMVLALLLPLQTMAVSLGDLTVRTVPGEPLRAHIPFTLLPGENLAEVRVTLAPVDEYQRRNIPRAELLQGLTIALLDRGEGKGRVQLFAEQPWQGNEVQILLLLSWARGEMERHYTLAAVSSPAESTPLYVEVAQDESLDEIAIRLSKGRNRSYLHMMYALFQANPEAFYRGNMNNLKSGRTLRIPTNEELYKLNDREVFDGIRSQYEQWQQLRDSRQQRGTQAGEALVGMSAEEAAALDLSNPDALQQRLKQVASDGELLRKENEALRQRLAVLEQRMQSVAGQVLDYADDDAVADKPSTAKAEPEKSDETEEGLSASTLFAAIVLVLLFVFYILYFTGHKHRGHS
jgi:FimV-like protein